MKDEEIAEEWCKENMDCCKIDNSVNQPIPYFSEEERCIAKSAFLAGLKAGRPQWHYVKDGDYPKDNKPVLCILGDIDSDNCEVGYYNDVGSGEPWHFETYHLPDDSEDDWGVSAWKEIVLPELPKEIE